MNEVTTILKETEQKLLKESKMLERSIATAPEGSLRVSHRGNYPMYYQWNKSNPDFSSCGKYISKNNQQLVTALAQKDYNKKLKEKLDSQIGVIQTFLSDYNLDQFPQTYSDLTPIRQKLVHPLYKPDDIFIKEWENREYPLHSSYEVVSEFYTLKGEHVRSKSEQILADRFCNNHIPYFYEYPLFLKGNKVLFPDFTILHPKTKQVYFLEHFGLMGNPDYVIKFMNKIETYIANGIYPGQQLITTFESKTHPLNVNTADQLIEAYFL